MGAKVRMKKAIIITVSCVAALAIGLLLLLCFTTVFGVSWLNVGRVYAREIERYLEEKYEEPFLVGSAWGTGHSSPVPDIVLVPPRTIIFNAYPLSDESYKITAYVTRSLPSYDIEGIRDSYYWRFLRPQLKEYVRDNFMDIFGEDMKIDINSRGGIAVDNLQGLNHNSTFQDFIASSETVTFRAHIFVPDIDTDMVDVVNERSDEFLTMLHENDSFSSFTGVSVYLVEDMDNYERINTSIDSDNVFWRPRLDGTQREFSRTFTVIYKMSIYND